MSEYCFYSSSYTIKSVVDRKPGETHSMPQTLREIQLLKHSAAVSDPCVGMPFMNISNYFAPSHMKEEFN